MTDKNDLISVMMTGSRNWTSDVKPFFLSLIENVPLLKSATPSSICLSHGNAKGADKISAEVALSLGWKTKAYEADWEKWRQKGNYKLAGVMRNQEMIDGAQPHVVIGFSCGDSPQKVAMGEISPKGAMVEISTKGVIGKTSQKGVMGEIPPPPISRGTRDALKRTQKYAKNENSRLQHVMIVRDDGKGKHIVKNYNPKEYILEKNI